MKRQQMGLKKQKKKKGPTSITSKSLRLDRLYVSCPSCSATVPDSCLNVHLDSCLLPFDAQAACSASVIIGEDAEHQVSTDKTELRQESATSRQLPHKLQDVEDLQPKVFPVFNKLKKTIHLIRHGHTTYSEGYFATKMGSHPFDVTLSPLGIQQATALTKKLRYLGAELILTSPLTRALQTVQHSVKSIQKAEAVKIEVSDLHTEHVLTSGDVGRPPKMLAEEFPWLSFTGLKDVWWFSPEEAPNDPIHGIFQSRESMDQLRKRVGDFRQFLLSRPEDVIIVIGHSTFFRELSGRRQRMQNCEILTIKV